MVNKPRLYRTTRVAECLDFFIGSRVTRHRVSGSLCEKHSGSATWAGYTGCHLCKLFQLKYKHLITTTCHWESFPKSAFKSILGDLFSWYFNWTFCRIKNRPGIATALSHVVSASSSFRYHLCTIAVRFASRNSFKDTYITHL